jgi:hypothetical protein
MPVLDLADKETGRRGDPLYRTLKVIQEGERTFAKKSSNFQYPRERPSKIDFQK